MACNNQADFITAHDWDDKPNLNFEDTRQKCIDECIAELGDISKCNLFHTGDIYDYVTDESGNEVGGYKPFCQFHSECKHEPYVYDDGNRRFAAGGVIWGYSGIWNISCDETDQTGNLIDK